MAATIATLIYIGAWILLLRSVFQRTPLETRHLLPIIALGACFHAFDAFVSIVKEQGFELGIFTMTSLFMWAFIVIVALSSIKKPLQNLFVFLLPAAAAGLVVDELSETSKTLMNIGPSMISHILLSVLAYSLLTIASLQALLLWYQNHKLRSGHLKGVMGLMPPLQTMETLLFELLWAGQILLTLSILSGLLFIEDIFAQHLAHKTVFSISSWCIYAVLLYGRHALGWRGKKAIRWTLGGFVALMLAYFGSKFVIEIILDKV